MNFFENYLKRLKNSLDSTDIAGIQQASAWMRAARNDGKQIFLCGNGGSAATASHLACDLVKGASYQRDNRFKVIALTDNTPTITAYSNDVSYDDVFVEQLKNFANKDDLVMGISASGNSENIIRTIEYANKIGCKTIGLSGRDGGKLKQMARLPIHVNNDHMGIIEDIHMIISHMLCYYFIDNEI